MDEVVGRKAPNTGTTTEAWAAIFERFKAGERISALAREYDLSFSAVSTRLQTAGVTRADHPRPRRKATVVAAAPPPLAGAEPPPAGAALVLPEGADARATARALADYSRALTRQGELREAADALRLARLHRLTEDGVAAANDDRAPLPAPPVLRGAQTPPEGDWRTWLFLGGRGAGKTLAGAAWLAGGRGRRGRGWRWWGRRCWTCGT
jgi:phage terminase large subunit-like protein